MAIDVDQLDSLSVPELVGLVKQLLLRVQALEVENASLKEQLRASKRPTAPFSKGKSKASPRTPGRRQAKAAPRGAWHRSRALRIRWMT